MTKYTVLFGLPLPQKRYIWKLPHCKMVLRYSWTVRSQRLADQSGMGHSTLETNCLPSWNLNRKYKSVNIIKSLFISCHIKLSSSQRVPAWLLAYMDIWKLRTTHISFTFVSTFGIASFVDDTPFYIVS